MKTNYLKTIYINQHQKKKGEYSNNASNYIQVLFYFLVVGFVSFYHSAIANNTSKTNTEN